MSRQVPSRAGETVVVTGGSRNLGLAMSQRFAREGARVVINGIVAGEAEDAARRLRDEGFDAHGYDADVADPGAVTEMFEFIRSTAGEVDVLVNNAAVTMRGRVPIEEMTLADWDVIFGVNARGMFLCTTAALPLMRAPGASIVNVSSIGATKAHRSASAYDATKGAIEAFTRAAALEFADRGIRVNAVAPGAISNDRYERLPDDVRAAEVTPIPLGRAGTADELASVVSFLASHDASYVTGHVLAVDGGLSVQARQATSELDLETGGLKR
ncbi:SDR family NAD(P)-dependent oxidoreductase [Agromyces sp. SYSU T00194]|uniref:SDR family NAD(P)-dependent oxidoreductase n=1 Tax=Agromyces chitinivorans TaxID=3158560 RepID=UPI00339552BA